MPPHGIDLMPGLSAVKVQTSILFTVPVVERYAVRPAVVAQHGQHASLFLSQDLQALLPRELLLFSLHLSEHSRPFYAAGTAFPTAFGSRIWAFISARQMTGVRTAATTASGMPFAVTMPRMTPRTSRAAMPLAAA